MFLSEEGCGYPSLMVMTGPHRGAIWEDLRPMDRGIAPTEQLRPLVPTVARAHRATAQDLRG
ncbi:hypothetical protein Scani_01840 [Streptomyces caniferus]|uniref:Uncharacterized protein n=1 Tax=Streptomyces caniferus TaxID=285557 RepID=A0A640S0K2_9ACTN|nr:hypothetical protein Scani_01840 [Streptomyces caniferus]